MEPILQLRGVTCYMGSHSVTFHLTQVNTPHHYSSQTGWFTYPGGMGGWGPRWAVAYGDG